MAPPPSSPEILMQKPYFSPTALVQLAKMPSPQASFIESYVDRVPETKRSA